MSLNLTPRLEAVARRVPAGARLADVGTDHAYLPAWLLLHDRISKAVCTDVHPGPLERAAETVVKWNVADRVSLRLCDGLAGVEPDEVDCVVIAGMGGETILHILRAAPWTAEKTCIIQPMSSLPDLRAQIGGLGLRIARETLVREKETLYVVMDLARGEEAPLTFGEIQVGRGENHRGDPLWPEYLKREISRLERALAGLEKAKDPTRASEWKGLSAALAEMKEMMGGA